VNSSIGGADAPPTVSVIIPTFNRARLVALTIDSVLAQTWRDVEVIVIDDGSTDDTPAVLAGYGNRIRSVRQPNRGMNPSRNTGIGLARGKYLALLDSDDLWEPWKLELDMNLLGRFPEAAFVFSDFAIMTDDFGVSGARAANGLHTWHPDHHDWARIYPRTHHLAELGIASPAARDVSVHLGCVFERSLHGPMVLPSTAVIRRSALEKHAHRLPESADTHGDWEFFSRLSRLECALFVDLETAINRSHEDPVRLTRADPRRRLERRISMIDRVWRNDAGFIAQHRREVDRVQCELLERLARMHLLADDRAASRQALGRAAALSGTARSLNDWASLGLALVPGTGRLLRMIRQLRHRLLA
jgi:glycosyltransferase involved in cell wall biosynthesis